MYFDDWDNGSYGLDKPNYDYFGEITKFDELLDANYKCNRISYQKNVTVPKLSGLAYDSEHNILYATSCETRREAEDEIPQGGVYMIDTENNYAVHQTWAIPFKSDHIYNTLESKEDTESVSISKSGEIYVAFEQTQEIVKISGGVENNDSNYDVIAKFIFTGKESGTDDGLEGFDFYGSDYCFVCNEKNPFEVIMHNLKENEEVYRQILTEIPSSGSIVDIACLESQNELWVLEQSDAKIYRYKIGLISLSYIGFISLPNTIKKNNPDALVLDTLHNCVYVGASGQGIETPTSKIFCIEVKQFARTGNEVDEYLHTLLQPLTALTLPFSASTLPHWYQNSRGLYATLPTTAHNLQNCQPVIAVSADTPSEIDYVMQIARPVLGASIFFYPEDLGYVNGTLTQTPATFVGLKVVGEAPDDYITTSGKTIVNPVINEPVSLYRVSYTNRGFNELSGDTFDISISGSPVVNDYQYLEQSEITVNALGGEKRVSSLFVNGTQVEPASAYTFNLSQNTTIKGVFENEAPWDGKCYVTIGQDEEVETRMYGVYVSGTALENGDYVMSGTEVTVIVQERLGYDSYLQINETHVTLSHNSYRFIITENTNFYLSWIAHQEVKYMSTAVRYDETSGDCFSMLTSDGDYLLINGESSACSGQIVTLSASTIEGRKLNVIMDSENITLENNVYEFDVSGESHVIIAEFGEPFNPCELNLSVSGYSDVASDNLLITNTFTQQTLSDGVYVLESGSTIDFYMKGGRTYREASLLINGEKVEFDTQIKQGGSYRLTMSANTIAEVVFNDTGDSNVSKVSYTYSGNEDGESLTIRADGYTADITQPVHTRHEFHGELESGETYTFDKNATTFSIAPKIGYGRSAKIYSNEEMIWSNNGTVTTQVTVDTVFNVVFSDSDFASLESNDYEISATSYASNINIQDLSGLALGKKDNDLYAVSNSRVIEDNGTCFGGVYTITVQNDGVVYGTISKKWTIPFSATPQDDKSISYEDIEAITLDSDDKIYLGFERLQQLVRPVGSGYTVIDTFDFTGRGHDPAADKKVTDPETGEKYTYDANEGIEGIQFLSGSTFFVGNQINPVQIILYDANTKTELNRQILVDETSGTTKWKTTDGDELEYEIADLAYVKSLNELWVMNSNRAVIYRYSVDVEAEQFLTYVASITLPMPTGVTIEEDAGVTTYTIDKSNEAVIANNNPEGLEVDENKGLIYVAGEGTKGGPIPGKLYVFKVENLKKK